jgi:hypothetical protein
LYGDKIRLGYLTTTACFAISLPRQKNVLQSAFCNLLKYDGIYGVKNGKK